MSALMKVFNVIKINLLSLLAFPLLLISLIAQLIMKAFEKALVFLGVGAAVIGLVILKAICKNPSGFLEGVTLIIVLLCFLGIISVIVLTVVYVFGSLASALSLLLITAIKFVLDFIFEISYRGYSALYEICETDHDALLGKSQSRYWSFACVFWHVLRLVNFVISKILSFILPLSVIASICLFGYSVFFIHSTINENLGIGVFTYLSLFPAVDAAFAVLYYLVLMVGIIIVILTLGYEWKELADSLEFGDSGLLLVLPDKTNGQIQLSETKPELLTGSSEERKAD
ncbi:MAG TPA: hypothetical protein PLD49_05995 [Thermoclostridium caenicola]|uniref:Uncharacterized protein n=1 Tax=Thermoclostridium caenicola TaxID=659425 RepID=A0A1M6G4Z8_9FIRM|nr:hypothetical protein [Thermoclostridium caenicola]SHJ04983.1 hypothetical protein SAMN05444373_102123 [Thermoclostridium caenicola]HOK43198.1 hypothetical protein [Thermoclostridium caenicola]HPO77547.1 hypothetical protein [Thermoclostridium caenicola]